MKEEELTIVIPTLATEFTRRALRFCLDSLQDFTGRVLVVVNGEEPIPTWTGVDWIKVDQQGQCKATNEAVKLVTTPWVLISNDDMIYAQKDWFQKLTYPVDNFGMLVASPNLVEPRKGAPPFLTHFCGGIGTEGTQPDYNAECVSEFVNNWKEIDFNPRYSVENGFNLPYLIRKDVWDTVGGYDEAYDPWGSCSDTDLQTRLLIAGVTPKRIRSALVYHFANTSGTFSGDRESFRHTNWRHYKAKFGFDSFKNPEVWYKPEIPKENIFHPGYEGKYV